MWKLWAPFHHLPPPQYQTPVSGQMRLLSSSGCMLARFFGSQGAHAVGHLLRTLRGFQLASATCRSKTELGKALACALLMEDTSVPVGRCFLMPLHLAFWNSPRLCIGNCSSLPGRAAGLQDRAALGRRHPSTCSTQCDCSPQPDDYLSA